MLLFALTSLLFTQTTCLPNIKPLMVHFFNNIPASYFFCEIQDAIKVIPNSGKYEKVKLLNENTYKLELLELQTISVFLDLSCDKGYDFLTENLNLFNATYHWLMWSDDVEKSLEFLRPSRIDVDSDVIMASDVKIYDLWRVHRTVNIEAVEIGFLKGNPRPSRTNFNQFVFNASLMMTDIPFNMSNLIPPLMDRSLFPEFDRVRRYGLSLFIHMAEYYNYSMKFVTSNAWGVAQPNGTWTGMIGDVVDGRADFGLAPAKYDVHRTAFIDFITSVYIVKVCFTFLQPKLFGTYKALVLPLDPIVWICLGVCSFFGIVAFKAVSKYDKTATCNDNLGGSTLMVLSSIAQQGFPENSSQLSSRIIYISMLLVTFFTAVYYNTAILNGLLLPSPNAIQNIEQLLKSDIQLGMQKISYIRYDTEAFNDTYSVQIRKKLAKLGPDKQYWTPEEGVEKIKKGQFAYYSEEQAIYQKMTTLSDAQTCALSQVEKYQPFHVGAVAADNSPLKDLFNKGFMLMRERGLMDRQNDHWLIKKPECHWKQDAISLGMEPMALAYFVIILGFILSFIALYLEKWKFRQDQKIQQPKFSVAPN